MNGEILNYQYSWFGNFSSIINDISKIANNFSGDFTRTMSSEMIPTNPTGMVPSNTFVFLSSKCGVKIGLTRIDFILPNISQNDNNQIEQLLKLIGKEAFGTLSRIALNLSLFYRDDNNSLLGKISNKIQLIDSRFNKSKEIIVRQNAEITIDDKPFNNILILQNTEIQSNNNFAKFKAIAFSIDINSNPLVLSNSFSSSNYMPFFSKMKSKAMNQISSFEKEFLKLTPNEN